MVCRFRATNHITNDMNNLSGTGLHILKTGSSIISTPNSNFHLKNILHVLDIASSLLSVHQFTKDNDCVFVFYASGFRIQDKMLGRTLFQGSSKNGLYPFNNSYQFIFSSCLCWETSSNSAATWHKRLGHPSTSVPHQIFSQTSLLKGTTAIPFCEYRHYAKNCKLPFPISYSVSTFPLQLVHSDVWGPAPTSSLSATDTM